MNHSHEGLPKVCCIYCTKEIYVRYFNKHIKSCKKRKMFEGKKIFIDYIICPICGMKLKEINNFHLNTHNLTPEKFDKLYVNHNRLSTFAYKNKNTLGNGKLTIEISNKLKYGHTIEGYIEKHGKDEGTKRFTQRLERFSKSRTIEGYIEKHGKDEGTRLYNKKINKISKNMKKLWKDDYDRMAKTHTLEGYIEKHGENEGIKRWINKNERNSISSRIININDIDAFIHYKELVRKITKISIRKFGLSNIEKVGRGKESYHVDHMIPCCYGFNNNIPAYIIGSIFNVEVISCSENCSKQHLYNTKDIIILTKEVNNNSFYDKIKKRYLNEENKIRSKRKI